MMNKEFKTMFHKSSNKKIMKERKAYTKYDLMRWLNYNKKSINLDEINDVILSDINCSKIDLFKLETFKKWFNSYFIESIEKYNQKQKRKDRKITNAFDHYLKIKNVGIAEYLLIGFGNENDFKDVNKDERFKNFWIEYHKNIFNFLKENIPNFKIYFSCLHLNENSPFIYVIGTPIIFDSNSKNGLNIKVSSSMIWTKTFLQNIWKNISIFNNYWFNIFLKVFLNNDSIIKQT